MSFLSVSQKRLIVGLIQGLMLYGLSQAVKHHAWPATDPLLLGPFALIALILPFIIIIGFGNLRPRLQVAWALIALCLLFGLARYNMLPQASTPHTYDPWFASGAYVPSMVFIYFCCAGFFIAQSLILAADADGRRIATYPRYFDVAWKLAVQINFMIFFAAVFWIMLWAGFELFQLIGVNEVREIVTANWFAFPITTLACSYALHITDVRANLVRGIRTLKLVLFSWLLPIMVLFAGGFLITLGLRGPDKLWATHHTSQMMLGAMSWLILLTNAAYQDGTPEHKPARMLRIAGTIGSTLLMPLLIIGAYAIWLRVDEYGWTINLVHVTAYMTVALCYATGYLWAALTPGAWLRKLEATNIFTAFVILALLFAIFTPIADPTRIAVSDQLHRLESGKVKPSMFDYSYLRVRGGAYGMDVLEELKAGEIEPTVNLSPSDLDYIKGKAAETLDFYQKSYEMSRNPPAKPAGPPPPVSAQSIAANITVYPTGQTLPQTFLEQDWEGMKKAWIESNHMVPMVPQCLLTGSASNGLAPRCEAFVLDKDSQQIIVSQGSTGSLFTLQGDNNRRWKYVGNMDALFMCNTVNAAMKAGQFKLGPSEDYDLVVEGIRVRIDHEKTCPR